MCGPEKLLSGYRAFRRNSYPAREELFRRLGFGQSPTTMVIACADSRVDPSLLFDAGPGELFVVRNVANLVPPFEAQGRFHGTSAALEFAVDGLGVTDILVMGHAGCGGIRASIDQVREKPVGEFIAPWIGLLSETRDGLIAATPDCSSEQLQVSLEHAAIAASLRNMQTFPFVRRALDEGRVRLHGAWFSIASGELHWRDAERGEFQVIDPQVG